MRVNKVPSGCLCQTWWGRGLTSPMVPSSRRLFLHSLYPAQQPPRDHSQHPSPGRNRDHSGEKQLFLLAWEDLKRTSSRGNGKEMGLVHPDADAPTSLFSNQPPSVLLDTVCSHNFSERQSEV